MTTQAERRWDAIVAGGGPGGAAAAYRLTRAGWRVLVLEKERLPRYKTCGGGLSMRFLQRNFDFSFAGLPRTEVRRMVYAYPGLTYSVAAEPGAISMVMRSELDNFLLEHSGAELRSGEAVSRVEQDDSGVRVQTVGGAWERAGYLIGADGANSTVARALGLRRHRRLMAALEVEAEAPDELQQAYSDAAVFLFGAIRRGYFWIFPKLGHLSVGIGALQPSPGELQAALRTAAAQFGISLHGQPVHGHPIPIYAAHEPLHTGRALLIGDAAGLVDPFAGEGIRYAVKSGLLAAECLLAGQVERYSARVHSEMGARHLRAGWVAAAFHRLEKLCLRLGAPNPFTTQAIGDLLADQSSPGRVLLRSVSTLPYYAAVESAARLADLAGRHGDRLRARLLPNFRLSGQAERLHTAG